MKCLLILAMFAASLASAAMSQYEETRTLELDAANLQGFTIKAGGGRLSVAGDPALQAIEVRATIRIPGASAGAARELMHSSLQLDLQNDHGRAVLHSYFDSTRRWPHGSPVVDLEVRVPASLALDVDDGSGTLTISHLLADLSVHDRSGSIELTDVGGSVRVDDGSGSLAIREVHGDLDIVDGSGSVQVQRVAGSVKLHDGSGSITVNDVEGDLVVDESGSGGIRYSNIMGAVSTDE